LSLPIKRNNPKENLSDYSMLLFGEKKIGKTSLAAQFPDALMLFFEPGGKSLDCFQMTVNNWDSFLEIIGLLKAGNHSFNTVVIDTVDIAYKLCFETTCEQLGINHPQDEKDFGKSWGLIRDEFNRAVVQLLALDMGCIFISHSEEKELKTRTGLKYNRIVPSMGNQAAKVLTGLVDCLFYYEFNGSDRQLVIEGDELVSAGTRITFAFKDANTKEKLKTIPMGTSASQAYQLMNKAFLNRLTFSKPVKKKPLTKLPKKRSQLLQSINFLLTSSEKGTNHNEEA